MAEQITTPTPEGNPGTGGSPAPTEKTFTQAEVDSLIFERLNRDRRTRESDPDFNAFKEWQKTYFQIMNRRRVSFLLPVRWTHRVV